MNTLRTVICSLIIASTSMALAQGGKEINGISPEVRAKANAAWQAAKRGDKFLKEHNNEAAIAAYREAVAIYDTISGFSSSYRYRLAKALTAAERNDEALATYKKAVQWNPKFVDLHVNGPPSVRVLMDYAILLARSGKEYEAKTVYYSGLRKYNQKLASSREPFPFIVVFDPDPTMTVWEYSPAKLIAAAKMAKAMHTSSEAETLTNEVRLIAPNWVFPAVYKASRRSGEWRTHYIDEAMSLARNEGERAWIRTFRDGETLEETGENIRKASIVLNAAKRDLEQNHHRIAVCECEGGHGG